jgi:hypothetical protein
MYEQVLRVKGTDFKGERRDGNWKMEAKSQSCLLGPSADRWKILGMTLVAKMPHLYGLAE